MIEVTAAIIITDDKYLLCQRGKDDEYGLMWEFPGGKLKKDESLEECIIREMQEELDILITVKKMYVKRTYFNEGEELRFTFFFCDIVEGDMKLLVHDDYAWVSKEGLLDYDYFPADVEIVKMITTNS